MQKRTVRREPWLSVLLIVPTLLPVDAMAGEPAGDGAALASRIARAAGVERFAALGRLRFSWKHEASGGERHFDWNIAEQRVTVTRDGAAITVPIAGPSDPDDEAQRKAHAAFINDSYWLLFELHLAWDRGVTFDDLGVVEVPQLATLGKRRALKVSYGAEGGYTPGDAYVLYLGDDDLPLAWAFHKGGQAEPSLVSTRGERITVQGVSMPTRFAKADGVAFISIEVEP